MEVLLRSAVELYTVAVCVLAAVLSWVGAMVTHLKSYDGLGRRHCNLGVWRCTPARVAGNLSSSATAPTFSSKRGSFVVSILLLHFLLV